MRKGMRFRWFGIFVVLVSLLRAEISDELVFGNEESEKKHGLVAERSEIVVGGLGEPCRRLLPGGERTWEGGVLRFKIRVDPKRLNYFTVRLWGDDVSANQLVLFVDGKQVGYRHLGDVEILDLGTDAAAYPGRFHYRTHPMPEKLTVGKEVVNCEIRASGPIWGYGNQFSVYQKPMEQPTRGIYNVYVHADGFFVPPTGEKQGKAPENPPVRVGPGEEVMDRLKERVNAEVERLLRDPKEPCRQMQMLFLAEAWHVKWTRAAGNPRVVEKVRVTLDSLYRGYVANPKLAEAEPSTYNPDWFGLGPCGRVLSLMEGLLRDGFEEMIDDGAGRQVKRRDGYRDMLLACRDWHREHRRQYTNQSMINDLYGIYLANRGLAVVAPEVAMREEEALRYLKESVGLLPWLGSEVDGKPVKPLGDSFYQITLKGLTRELGYVGNYGEVLDWVSQIHEATRPVPGKEGNREIRDQLVKIARARSVFRYPMLDPEGYRAMVMETAVGWRDTHYPGDVTYDQRTTWDGSPFEVAAATLDPHLVGYCQQMLEDRQFFASVERQLALGGFRVTFGLMGIPDRYDIIRRQAPVEYRLPMTKGQGDFVFADEIAGVVGLRNGEEVLYASLYWRARYGVNFLSRVHHMTPEHDRIATVRVETKFTDSGLEYVRPNWTNFCFGNGGPRYPAEFVSAHEGERLPIAKIAEGISFKAGQENMDAGRGDFYQLRYGRYFIAMNMSREKTFAAKAPEGGGRVRDLVKHAEVEPGSVIEVPPLSTVVWYLD